MPKKVQIAPDVKMRSKFGFNWQTAIIAAGIAFLAPYVIRRVLPLLEGSPLDITGRDLVLAGKDSVRDAQDDLEVGGIGGEVSRAVDRVADRLTH